MEKEIQSVLALKPVASVIRAEYLTCSELANDLGICLRTLLRCVTNGQDHLPPCSGNVRSIALKPCGNGL
jgi:hypothetical protein